LLKEACIFFVIVCIDRLGLFDAERSKSLDELINSHALQILLDHGFRTPKSRNTLKPTRIALPNFCPSCTLLAIFLHPCHSCTNGSVCLTNC
jgi:hypothetical protein